MAIKVKGEVIIRKSSDGIEYRYPAKLDEEFVAINERIQIAAPHGNDWTEAQDELKEAFGEFEVVTA